MTSRSSFVSDASSSSSLFREADFDRIYRELRGLAARRLAQLAQGQTLDATGLVHEVWLKLSEDSGLSQQERGHYYATAAQAMRWILIDRARRRHLARRTRATDSVFEALPAQASEEEQRDLELLALDAAVEKFAQGHPRKSQVVLLRYFAGLSVEQTAEQLGVSAATVKREWTFARAWLSREMGAETSLDF